MPFKPFHIGSTTVPKKVKAPVPPTVKTPAVPQATKAVVDLALKRMKAVTKMARPSGSGPRGSAGYFDN